MFCDEVLERVDELAASDEPLEERVAAHVASCAGCGAALEAARRVERLLRTRDVPPPPPQFTSRIMGRIRRERWRRDQFLDAGFNVVVGLVVVSVMAAFWIVLAESGLSSISRDAVRMVSTFFLDLIWRIAPSVPVYGAAGAFLAAALGVWWWAEKSDAET
jgi:hypothetical protein